MNKILLTLFLLPLFSISQVDKIKISKRGACSFEVKIDADIEGKKLRVRKIDQTGLTTQESNSAFHAYRGVDMGDRITIEKKELEVLFFKICWADDKHLKEVKVVSVNDGMACALEFTYEDTKLEN